MAAKSGESVPESGLGGLFHGIASFHVAGFPYVMQD
jgi:hypothetical protein